MRVLVVDDDQRLVEAVRRGLTAEGMTVDVAHNGDDALWRASAAHHDAIVMDVMMPGLDGVSACRRMRDGGVWCPVLLLTARDAVEDRVAGLNAGADDYLVKPFAFEELVARVHALARRGRLERPSVLEAGDLRLDPAAHLVRRGEHDIELSQREYALLYALMSSPGVVLDRLELIERAWGWEYDHRSNIVEVYINYLRNKIDKPFGVSSIETVRGAGHRMRGDGGRR
jgi:two-component system OmpR family response regulator